MPAERRYAQDTTVSTDRSRTEIEKLLVRYDATAFGYAWENDTHVVSFKLGDRHVRIFVPMPVPGDDVVARTDTGRRRNISAQQSAHEREVRRRWRALVLIVKAKLEAVESGITTLEREFLSDIVMPNNQTVGQWIAPQLEEAYRSGKMPPLLPGPKE
jgi:hypothetical protein